MDVTLQYCDDCPNWKVAEAHLQQLARELPDIRLNRLRIDTLEEAERVGFRGSPSVLVDGADVFARDDAPGGLSCRIYQTPDGMAGSPTLEQLREQLTGRMDNEARQAGTH
ncbi:hypothetical protein BH24ACT5_BH24ACT5_28560 [soil metagenome]